MNTNAKAIADRYVPPDGAPHLSHVPDSWTQPTVGHNNPPPSPYDTIKQEIEDLFLEAKNWADGEPIADQKQADAVTELLELIADAMKRADEARKEEKRPLDEAVDEIQRRYNALIGKTTKLTGRAVMAKEALQTLLTPWRNKLEAERRAEAARLAKEAADAAAEAQAAMQASRGNLEERDKAEELYQAAQDIARVAKRADKAATTKTGLRSVWSAVMVDEGAAMDWGYGLASERFRDLTQQIADEAVRSGMRKVPGFKVTEERVAR
ncbi:MAG: hypothetical protein OJJ21_16725 [Ferrovibrio sp.]|uniref:hypothetical protein n=1 Tax=Ferrovibrio sp. TaxID=1917215 RepID=UPI00263A33AD|nr:hypothetical protein [Ferrovibrio sp.]MCW0235247.1 hypothetical protein [Ferrovibrio sp.]